MLVWNCARLGQSLQGTAGLKLATRRVVLAGDVPLTVTLHSTAAQAQRVVVDNAVHRVKADVSLSPKMFKGWRRELPPAAAMTLTRGHALRPVTTRRYRPGNHEVVVQVHAVVQALGAFTLALLRSAR